jgi:hypothetical protein
MRLSYFLLAPILALSASAQVLNRDFAIEGCVALTTVTSILGSGGLGLSGSYGSETLCRVSCTAIVMERTLTALDRMPAPPETTSTLTTTLFSWWEEQLATARTTPQR